MNTSRLEQLGTAAAGIAHDINNQLHLIVNHLAVSDVESANRAATRCSALTGNLLAFCRGEDGVELTAVDPAEFLLDFVDQSHFRDGVSLRLHLAPPLPAIRADRFALTRILTNIISNASDAIEGHGTIRIEAGPCSIAVSDSGPGIPPEVARRIFEPFFTTKGSQGTGLGLPIVRALMTQQGGSVRVDSEPGRGCRFTLYFRAAEEITELAA